MPHIFQGYQVEYVKYNTTQSHTLKKQQTNEHTSGTCRNLPFGRGARRNKMASSHEENAWSRHQRLFEENARKTKNAKVYVF